MRAGRGPVADTVPYLIALGVECIKDEARKEGAVACDGDSGEGASSAAEARCGWESGALVIFLR
jgi:hypothetical protein